MPATETKNAYKQPYFISPTDGQTMAMAGLYEFWRDRIVAEGDDPAAWVATCTVITTEAAGRMPRACRWSSSRTAGRPGSTGATRTPPRSARC